MIYTIHPPRARHLEEVKKTMLEMGPPTIRVVDCTDYWVAIEGVHRLQAACDLGVAPVFVVHDQEEEIVVSEMDIVEMFPDGTHILPAGEVAAECYHSGSGCYSLNEVGLLRLVLQSY